MSRYLRKDHPFGVPILTRRHDRFGPGHQRRLLSVLSDRCRLVCRLYSVFVHLLGEERSRTTLSPRINPISSNNIQQYLAIQSRRNGFVFVRSPRYVAEEDAFFVLCLVLPSLRIDHDTPERHAVATITVDPYDNLDRLRIFLVLSPTK